MMAVLLRQLGSHKLFMTFKGHRILLANMAATMNKRYIGFDRSKKWVAEKVLTGSLLALTPMCFYMHYPWLDYVLGVGLVLHCNAGLMDIAGDYIRPSLFGEKVHKLTLAAVQVVSALVLAGVLLLNYGDVGLIRAIIMFWNL